jgi:hypothetical protein
MEPSETLRRDGRRIARGVLRCAKRVGVALVVGSLGALAAMCLLTPAPDSAAGWAALRDAMRAVFWWVFFGGFVIVAMSGINLFLLSPRAWLATGWFRAKLVVLAIAIPSLHLWARGRALAFEAAVAGGDLAALPERWRALGTPFLVAAAFFALVALIARAKTR